MILAVPATTDLPAVGTSMFLVLGEGVNFRSRLESVDGDTFTVTAPLETAGPLGHVPGQEFEVFWAPPRTRVVLRCRLVSVSDEAPFRWTLVPLEAPRQSNRREFMRGGGGAAVLLTTEGEDGHEIEGALLDISEGGLRCWIDEPAKLAPGDRLRASVSLGGSGEIDVTGTILTVRKAPHGDPGQHVVLTFNSGETLAQMIRLYVLTWEINERRMRNESF
ncbi:PilZ domain-containing protein [Actinoplanes sp. LDG1-06]|uniref:PilZ domain-containing protein n=1 Tax=Paractinoplanes ovalisporus TaxID=2810368 RepID=A0ABS2ALM8_9ACTN|nr:PilZ domain-containing protein [Actinoplanes ovalisporus]MBM2620673.1 PilZ domain-containing protein [Actinoplanes ovalisporus]